jgi:hypothetical protein
VRVFSFLYVQLSAHNFDSLSRAGSNSRLDRARLYCFKSGIQCAFSWIFFASCIDCRHITVEVTPSNDSPEGFGLIGLGPSSGSQVLAAVKNSSADPPTDRIFRQDTSVPNFISVLLNRPNDTHATYTGEMTISEVLPLFQNISSQPKVPVSILQSSLSEAQHFSILLDADGIIGPDGNAIKMTSNASLAPSHNPQQLQMVFDTGFSLPQMPE